MNLKEKTMLSKRAQVQKKKCFLHLYVSIFLFLNVFFCIESQLQNMGSSVFVQHVGSLVVACSMWVLDPEASSAWFRIFKSSNTSMMGTWG